MYSFTFVFSTVVSSLIFLLGAFVYFHNRSSFVNKIFFGFSLSTLFWIQSVLWRFITDDYFIILIATRLSYVAAAIIGFMVTYFGYLFPIKNKYKLPLVPLIVILFMVVGLSFSPYVLKDIKIINGVQNNIFGPLFFVYLIYFPIMVIWGFYNLLSKYKFLTKSEFSQVKIVLVGILISFIIGVSTNLFIPRFFETSITEPYGPLGVFFLISFTAYAIIKHQLMNVKLIATEIFSTLIVIILMMDALLANSIFEFILKGILFLTVAFFSYLLVISIRTEIRTREKLAQATERLEKANVELKKLDKVKSEFLSIASHQLRTPLTVIKGYSSMILEGEFGEIKDKMKEVVDKIFQSSLRLVHMIEDFLNISRIEAGRMKYDFTKFDLKKMIDDLIDDLKKNNPLAKKLKMEFTSNDKEIIVRADQNKIRQVISNIIDNAIKYTEKGFVKISLSKNLNNNKILIKVHDSGMGIEPNMKSELFKKFTRLEAARHLHTEGSGLGLYVAKIIVEDHKGRIWAESEGVNKGSTFFIELPIS